MKNNSQVSNKWFYWLVLAIIFTAGLGIRLYDLTDLPLDFHPTRQLRSAIIARGLYYQMQPQADEYRQTAALQAMKSLEAYEPPIFESLTALTYRLASGEHLWIARVYSAGFWLIAALFLWLTLRRWKLRTGALAGLGVFLLAPFLVQASRSFQPDPFMVMWIAIFVYLCDRFTEQPTWKWAILAGAVGGLAVLVKVFAGLFVAAVFALVMLGRFGFKGALRSGKIWAAAGLIVSPAVVYYLLILGGRSGGFFSSWTLAFLPLLIDPGFYADWLHMLDSLFSLSLVVAALAGLFWLPNGPRMSAMGLWIGYLLYGLISPYQFVTHTYYHLPAALLLAVGLAPLAEIAWQALSRQPWICRAAVLVLLAGVSGYYLYVTRSVLAVDNFRSEPIGWQRISEALPKDGPVIALTQDYGNRLMYFGLIKVSEYWPTTSGQNLSEAKGKGGKDFEATFAHLTEGRRYFLVTALGQLDVQPDLKKKLTAYTLVGQGDGYLIYDLTQPQ